MNVFPSETTNSSERTLGVPRSGKYTSLSAPPRSVCHTLLSRDEAVPKPSLSAGTQAVFAPGAPGAAAPALAAPSPSTMAAVVAARIKTPLPISRLLP